MRVWGKKNNRKRKDIHLLGEYLLPPEWGGRASKPRKEKEKRDRGTEDETSYPDPGN